MNKHWVLVSGYSAFDFKDNIFYFFQKEICGSLIPCFFLPLMCSRLKVKCTQSLFLIQQILTERRLGGWMGEKGGT